MEESHEMVDRLSRKAVPWAFGNAEYRAVLWVGRFDDPMVVRTVIPLALLSAWRSVQTRRQDSPAGRTAGRSSARFEAGHTKCSPE